MENPEQELMFKLSYFEQQIKLLQNQLEAVEQALFELSNLSDGLNEMKNGKDREILASVGRGIFAKAKLLSDELIVDVGGKNFVKKSIPDTQNIIEAQSEKLEMIRKELEDNLEKVNEEVTKTFEEAQNKSG
ncbi:MAG: prefoldin subunit alpha [Nanoarchaeota archaeon]